MGIPLHLLQLEDSESDAALIVRELEKSGYEVSALRFEDGDSMARALEMESWDLIICDYRMPAFGAPEALEILKRSGNDIPFLVISGTIGEESAVGMMKAGAHDYLMKDNLWRLASAVDRELREAATRAASRLAIQQLQESETTLSLALESAEMGIFDHDIASGKIHLTGLARRHLSIPDEVGLTLEHLIGVVHPEDSERVRSALSSALERNGTGRYYDEYRLRRLANGEERWIAAGGKLLRDAGGNPLRLLGTLRDISDRKRSEIELRFQIELIARITEQSRDCILLTDRDGQVRFVNPETIRLFGFTLEEYQASSPHNLLHHHYPDGRPYPPDECELSKISRNGGTLRECEAVHFHRNGQAIHVLVSSVPLEIGGTRLGTVYTYRDITERKLAERALQRSDERFKRLFDADIIGVMVVDRDYFLEVNGYFLRLLGYTREEFFAQKPRWRSHVAPELIARCERDMDAILRGDACPAFEKDYIRKDGSHLPTLFAAVQLTGADGSQLLCFALDLTERKNLEQQFRQAQKLESVGQLAGGVAHDFNNLLTVIMGYSDMLLSQIEPEHPFHGAMEQILAAAVRASGLTRQLLTFSRRNSVSPKTIRINELVLGIEKMLRRLIGEDVEVTLLLSRDAAQIHADPGLIEQVIINLAVNSRDAMPEGGNLFIETSQIAVADEYSALSLGVPMGTYVSLEVTDTGIGMTPEVQARLFEPFFTTKEQGKGTGLGLSTVYGIVKQSGGSIKVQSSPGAGTAFRILFPSVSQHVVTAPSLTDPTKAHGVETVLLVEDESGVRNFVLQVLAAHGYQVLNASCGEEALRIARAYPGAIHLMITDVVLPGMKGSDLIREFLEVRPGIPILRMSGYPERFGDSLPNCFPYLQKPFKPEVLLNRIRKMLDATAMAAVL